VSRSTKKSRSTLKTLQQSTLRKRMKANETITAAWQQIPHPIATRMSACHHDVIVVDAEHGGFDIELIAVIVETASNNGAETLVRVPLEDVGQQPFARRCLDAGVAGILFPNVKSPKDARDRVRVCYYPTKKTPWGTRGFGFGGCNNDGDAFADYAEIANKRVVAGVQLENKDAFKKKTLKAILSTPGLIFSQDGPYDHSGSYLVPGETSDKRVVADLKRYRKACKKHGVVAGKHVVWPTEDNIEQAVSDGYGFMALGIDGVHVMDGSKAALDIVRKATS